jgi:hypothetical protein
VLAGRPGRVEQRPDRRVVTRLGQVLDVRCSGHRRGASLFQDQGGPAVRGEPPARADRFVDHVTYQRVAEAEPARRVTGTSQVARDYLVKGTEHVMFRDLSDLGDQLGLEGIPAIAAA